MGGRAKARAAGSTGTDPSMGPGGIGFAPLLARLTPRILSTVGIRLSAVNPGGPFSRPSRTPGRGPARASQFVRQRRRGARRRRRSRSRAGRTPPRRRTSRRRRGRPRRRCGSRRRRPASARRSRRCLRRTRGRGRSGVGVARLPPLAAVRVGAEVGGGLARGQVVTAHLPARARERVAGLGLARAADVVEVEGDRLASRRSRAGQDRGGVSVVRCPRAARPAR